MLYVFYLLLKLKNNHGQYAHIGEEILRYVKSARTVQRG